MASSDPMGIGRLPVLTYEWIMANDVQRWVHIARTTHKTCSFYTIWQTYGIKHDALLTPVNSISFSVIYNNYVRKAALSRLYDIYIRMYSYFIFTGQRVLCIVTNRCRFDQRNMCTVVQLEINVNPPRSDLKSGPKVSEFECLKFKL